MPNFLWPFIEEAKVTTRYDSPRARGLHRAWDVATFAGSPIVAPEAGQLLLFQLHRGGDEGVDHTTVGYKEVLPNEMSHYSWYWRDRYGVVAVLLGETYWWLFAHVQAQSWWATAQRRALSVSTYRWLDRDPRTNLPARYVELETNADDRPLPALAAGDHIAALGDTGYSTGAHCHFEIAPRGNPGAPSRLDPAQFWPDR